MQSSIKYQYQQQTSEKKIIHEYYSEINGNMNNIYFGHKNQTLHLNLNRFVAFFFKFNEMLRTVGFIFQCLMK